MSRPLLVLALVASCTVGGCSGDGKPAGETRGAPSNDAERKAVADLARRSAEANAAVDARRVAGKARPADLLRSFEGRWTSVGPFGDGRLRITVGRDGAIVAETLTRGGATSSSAIGSVTVGASGSVAGTLSRPYGPLRQFAAMAFSPARNGRITVRGQGDAVDLVSDRD